MKSRSTQTKESSGDDILVYKLCAIALEIPEMKPKIVCSKKKDDDNCVDAPNPKQILQEENEMLRARIMEQDAIIYKHSKQLARAMGYISYMDKFVLSEWYPFIPNTSEFPFTSISSAESELPNSLGSSFENCPEINEINEIDEIDEIDENDETIKPILELMI